MNQYQISLIETFCDKHGLTVLGGIEDFDCDYAELTYSDKDGQFTLLTCPIDIEDLSFPKHINLRVNMEACDILMTIDIEECIQKANKINKLLRSTMYKIENNFGAINIKFREIEVTE